MLHHSNQVDLYERFVENEELLEIVQNGSYDVLVFDFDGTMMHTEDFHWKYFHDVLEEAFDIDYPYPEHGNVTGLSYTQIWQVLGGKYNFDVADERLVAAREKMSSNTAQDLIQIINRPPYSYFSELMFSLKNNSRKNRPALCALSANDVPVIVDRLVAWDIADMFSAVFSTCPTQKSKTDVLLPYVKSMSKNKTPSVLVFEDSVRVLRSYRKLALKFDINITNIAICHPFSTPTFEDAECVYDYAVDVRNESSILKEAEHYQMR